MPAGMKAIGGHGNGVFECVQDIVGYTDLCYISLKEFGDVYCVCRFGDDMGFKSNTLIPAEDVRNYIVPNSIPAYIKPEGYLAMIEAAREFRGD